MRSVSLSPFLRPAGFPTGRATIFNQRGNPAVHGGEESRSTHYTPVLRQVEVGSCPIKDCTAVPCTAQLQSEAGHRFDFGCESRTEKPCADDTAEDRCPGGRALERHGSDGYELSG